ncbi:MAG: hypothetical protein ACLSGB_16225 [Dorea sp.]
MFIRWMQERFFKWKEVHFHSPKDAAKAGIGMVHQEFMLYKGMTVLENIILGTEKKSYRFPK